MTLWLYVYNFYFKLKSAYLLKLWKAIRPQTNNQFVVAWLNSNFTTAASNAVALRDDRIQNALWRKIPCAFQVKRKQQYIEFV